MASSAWRHQIGQNITAHIREEAHSVIVCFSAITPSPLPPSLNSLSIATGFPKTHLDTALRGTGIHINTLYCTFSITFYKSVYHCTKCKCSTANESAGQCTEREENLFWGADLKLRCYSKLCLLWVMWSVSGRISLWKWKIWVYVHILRGPDFPGNGSLSC